MKLQRLLGLAALAMSLASPMLVQSAQPAARKNAQAQALAQAMTPGAGQKKLESMIGTFDVRILTWVHPGNAPLESAGVCINSWVLDGRYMRSVLSAFVLDEPFNGIGYVAYDNASRTYQTAWMDSGSTGMVWYRGGFDASGQAAKLAATVTDPTSGKPTPVELRMTMAANGDHVTELWGQGLGRKFFKLMELRYTRSKQ